MGTPRVARKCKICLYLHLTAFPINQPTIPPAFTLERLQSSPYINTLSPRRNGQHFADHIFKRIFFIGNVWISIKISLKFVPKGPIYNIAALVQIMAWRRPGDKPLFETMIDSLPTHICVTRPQWVNTVVGLNTTCEYEKTQWTAMLLYIYIRVILD